MLHAIRVERVFNLGDYKSLRIVTETTEISDADWNDPEALADIRADLQSEIMASFALHMMTIDNNMDEIKAKDYQAIYGKYTGSSSIDV